MPLASLTRDTLLHRDVHSHDAILMAPAFADGSRIEIFMDDPQWVPLAEALDRDSRLVMPSATWQVQAIADGPGAAPMELLG
ncbi:hypothetical protein [Nevskia sp.]|uniref:hypothetical protein n=1 Tax=Nevskia sp. TaxID=1929292 RepID=UPI0025E3BD5C|nr:hypothetical protein [Nevskia sp.]